MILSDRDIAQRLDEDPDFAIDPLDDIDLQIQPASVDLRLDSEFRDPDSDSSQHGRERYTLLPGEFVLGTTLETVTLSPDLIGQVHGRSSIGRLGVQVHITAGVIDPGFRGQITLELKNVSDSPVVLESGMRIAQIVFQELRSKAERPYGTERDSKYQDQRGPQASRLGEDPEHMETEQ